jgi:hypothetical protein
MNSRSLSSGGLPALCLMAASRGEKRFCRSGIRPVSWRSIYMGARLKFRRHRPIPKPALFGG